MNKFIVSMLMMLLFFLPLLARADQQEAQRLCVEKTVNRCVDQCQKTSNINCATSCQKNAQNRCRQAGE
jgi:hypothetical protein